MCVCVTDRQRPLHFRNSFRVPEITCLVKFGQADPFLFKDVAIVHLQRALHLYQIFCLFCYLCDFHLSVRLSPIFFHLCGCVCVCVCVCFGGVFWHFWMLYTILSAQKKMFTKSFFTQNFTCIFFFTEMWVKQGGTQCYQEFQFLSLLCFFLKSCKQHCDSFWMFFTSFWPKREDLRCNAF